MPASAERRLGAAIASLVVGAAALAGCSSDPKDPAEVRRGQVRDRLEATFSDAQASCILDALDDTVIRALVRTTDLDPESEAYRQYSNVVLLCARSGQPAATTTTAALTTTTAAATTTAAG